MDLIDREALIEEFKKLRFPCMLPSGADYLEGIQAAVKRYSYVVSEAPAVNRWIPCSERLPLGGRVLATTQRGYVIEVIFVAKGSQWFRNGEYYPTDPVIAWMPIPDAYEPPKEGAKDD